MYRQLAYDAMKKGLLQYFDIREPILPPPRGEHWVETADEVNILVDHKGWGVVRLDPDRHTATITIDIHEIYHYLPGDEEFHEELFSHVPMQHNRVLPDEYVLEVDMSDEDWQQLDDSVFDVKTMFKRRPSPNYAHKGIHRR